MIIVTGSSRGIGKAIAHYYLEKGEKVIGIARTNTIQHENFTFEACDLSNIESLNELSFLNHIDNSTPVTLINNAGTIGDIQRADQLDLKTYYAVAVVNIVAVQYLSTMVLKNIPAHELKAIVNISSGAGRRAIPSWSAYCASKAAIDLYSETLHAEFQEQERTTKIYSVAPGVVDTKMQVTIRSSDPSNFSAHDTFMQLKNNNELRSPKTVARLLHELLEKEQGEVITRLTE
jgi:benzil reductase ((S)-benzoin forming)